MKEQLEDGKTVVFAPKGTSMLPMLRQGIDNVVIKKAPAALKKYDLPLYLRENGQFVLHRVVAVEKNSYTMCGDNQFQREYGVKQESILAVAVGFYRGDKYISCDDAEYLRYCKKQVLKQRLRYYMVKLNRIIKRILHLN